MKELIIGDVVRLKSDKNRNTLMTINGHSADGRDFFICAWFVNGELRQGSFHKDALIIVD
ncbi:DUF2158 domain-containing protein [Elizabethkingia anophelis]|nr:DUF2158 domain-containing protein [Elizabethkingia anophelis]